MTWVQEQLDDETLFPSKIGKLLRIFVNSSNPRGTSCPNDLKQELPKGGGMLSKP